jgi:TPP-dependent 2-oxoacid decarboxylase
MQVTIGQHLINRLKEVNVNHIFGVPGDYNMVNIYTYMTFQFYIDPSICIASLGHD